jgi:hypothetical protein
MRLAVRLMVLLCVLVMVCAAQMSVTIASGQTVSSTLNAGSRWCTLAAIQVPAGWTGGATVTFKASAKGTTFDALVDDVSGATKSVPVTASRFIALTELLSALWTAPYVQIVAASAVTRTETIDITCR